MYRIHHLPAGELSVTTFEAFIQGEKTAPWYCRVSAMPYNTVWPGGQRPIEQTELASFISFEMDEPIEVKLVACRSFQEAVVRPLSKGILPRVSGREIAFTIDRPGSYTVELDGWHNALHIFANPLTDFGVDKAAPGVRYFGPGVHEVGNLELEDGETLFLDGGAVLYGSVWAIHKKNVRIVGYGVIDGSREERTSRSRQICSARGEDLDCRSEETVRALLKTEPITRGCVRLYSCQDCEIAGVIARDSSEYAYTLAGCERLNCEWIKTIGMWRYNSDGIDLFNCCYVRIANGFFRNFDDCIVLKGIKGWDQTSQHHIAVTGCTVWCDWGRCLELGAETCADEYYDILWDDCDLIHGTHIHIDLQNGDRARIHDMLVRNIRCEYSAHDMPPVYQQDMSAPYEAAGAPWQPTLIESVIYNGMWSRDHMLGETYNIRLEDIHIYGPENMPCPKCRFVGADEAHCNHDIVIENAVLNGRRLAPEQLCLEMSAWDRNITVK